MVVPIKDAYGNMHLFNVRLALNDFGMEPKTSSLFKDQACKLLGIEEKYSNDFNFIKQNKTIHMIIGGSSPFSIPQIIDPSTLNLNYPVTSPSLKLVHSFLTHEHMCSPCTMCGELCLLFFYCTMNFFMTVKSLLTMSSVTHALQLHLMWRMHYVWRAPLALFF